MKTKKNLKKSGNILFKIGILSVVLLLIIGIADLVNYNITGKAVLTKDFNIESISKLNPLSNLEKTSAVLPKISEGSKKENLNYDNLKFGINAVPVKLPDDKKVGDLSSYTIDVVFYLNTSMREDKYYPWYPLVAEYSGGSKKGTDKGRYILSLTSKSSLVFTINSKGAPNNIITVQGDYDKKWTHVIVIVDNLRLTQKVRLYTDGKLKATSDIYPIDKTSKDYDLLIGALPNNYGTVAPIEYFSGIIKYVNLYKKSLTEEEIKSLFIEQKVQCIKDIECNIKGQSCVNNVCLFKVSDGYPVSNTSLNNVSEDNKELINIQTNNPTNSGSSSGSGGSSGGRSSSSSDTNTPIIDSNDQQKQEEVFGETQVSSLGSENNQQQVQDNSGVKTIIPKISDEPKQNRNIYLAISLLLVSGGITGLYFMLRNKPE